MPVEDAGLMAAIDAGIADAAPSAPAPTPTPVEGNSDDGDSASTEGGDEPSQPTGAAGAQPDAQGSDGAGDQPAAGDEAAGAKPDAAAGDGDEAQADAKTAAGEPAKQPDPLNDPLPNALKRETKERIHTLIGMVKETGAKAETFERNFNELYGAISETRASPEQYGQALEYLRMVNSGDRAQQEQALDFMQRELAALARMIGKPVPGVNMLEGHEDLIHEVSTGRLSPERAQEIAAARSAAQHQVRQGQARTQQETQQRQQAEEQARGRADLNALGKQLQAIEPVAYAAKRAILVNSLKPVFAKIPPSEWAATFKRAYDALPVPAAAPRPPTPPAASVIPQNTPLRASQPAGAARAAPASVLDAINAGIADAGR